jgi:hypothetical protein
MASPPPLSRESGQKKPRHSTLPPRRREGVRSPPEAFEGDPIRRAQQLATERFLRHQDVHDPGESVVHSLGLHPRINVVAVTSGPGLGVARGEPAIQLWVMHKVHESVLACLPEDYTLPKELGGVRTEVLSIGDLVAQSCGERTAHPGCSVGAFTTAGTFGAYVWCDQRLCVLSNNHVLAAGDALAPGADIFAPALIAGGTLANKVGQLFAKVELDRLGDNFVDAALAELSSPQRTFAPNCATAPCSDQALVPANDMEVEKIGFQTNRTQGTVLRTNADVRVRVPGLGRVLFKGQTFVSSSSLNPFSDYGDSGALVLEPKSRQAVGLLMGGNVGGDYRVSVVTPLVLVLEQLSKVTGRLLRLVTSAGP